MELLGILKRSLFAHDSSIKEDTNKLQIRTSLVEIALCYSNSFVI